MNWLAQNVVGYIPEIEEVNERAQELMQLREQDGRTGRDGE